MNLKKLNETLEQILDKENTSTWFVKGVYKYQEGPFTKEGAKSFISELAEQGKDPEDYWIVDMENDSDSDYADLG